MVKNSSHLFQGILNRTMIMGETREWLDTGRFLERSCQTARLLDVKYHDLLPSAAMSRWQELTVPDSTPVHRRRSLFGVGGPLDMRMDGHRC